MTIDFFENLVKNFNRADSVKNALDNCRYCDICEESELGEDEAAKYFGSEEVNKSELGSFVMPLNNGSKMIENGVAYPCTEDARITIFDNEFEEEHIYTYVINDCNTGDRL